MPDFGIGEALAGLFGGGLGELGALFGIGEAAAAPAAAGLGAAEGIGAEAGASLAGLGAADLGAASAPLALTVSPELGAVGAGLGADLGAGAGAELAGAAGLGGAAVPGIESLFGDGASVANGALSGPTVPTTGAATDSLLSMFPNTANATSAPGLASGPIGAPGTTSIGGTPGAALPSLSTTGAGSGVSAASTAAPTGASGLDLSSLSQTADAAGAPPAAAGSGGIMDTLKGVGSIAGPAVAAGGLAYNILNNPKTPSVAQSSNALQAEVAPLAAQASNLTASGNQYASYLQSGTLPAGLQGQVDSAVKSAKAQIISRYASQGLPTDPNHNSSLQAELQGVDQKAIQMSGQLGQQLLTSGTNLINAGTQISGLETQILNQLVGIDQTQTANMAKAISSFAASLAPSKVNTTTQPAAA